MPPISSPLTSASIDSGTSIGSASMLSVVAGWLRTPPSLMPGASSAPCKWTLTVAWMATSSRTSCRSMWRTWPRIGSRWYSFRIDGCAVRLAFEHDVEHGVQPRGAGQRGAEVALADGECLRARAPVEDARNEALLAQAPRLGRAEPGPFLHLETKSVAGHGGGL